MGTLILLIILLFYIVSYYIAFKMPMSMTTITFPEYERLRYGGRVFGFISWLFLIIVLIIHAAAYWAYVWTVKMFSFLLWINNQTDDEESYLFQVSVIIFFTLLPVGKYTYSLTSRFKKQLFICLQNKYNTKFKVIDNKKYFPRLRKKSIARYALTHDNFREIIIENYSDKDKRYKSQIYLDDVLSFRGKCKICEVRISVKEEVCKEKKEGEYKWSTGQRFSCFDGLIIIINKTQDKTNKSNQNTEPKLYKINNNKALVQSDSKRSKKKNTIIAEVYLGFLGEQQWTDLIEEPLASLRNVENLENYDTINKPLAQIAETLNVDYVIEDNKKIYLFHKEKGIDFFTYYQNKGTNISAEIFEEDFKLLLEISEKF